MKNMKKRSLRRIFAGILGIGILLTGAAPCAAAAYGYDEYGDPIVLPHRFLMVRPQQSRLLTPAIIHRLPTPIPLTGGPKVPASKHRLQSLWT